MRHYRELWQYREMICSLVRRDLKVRYRGSVLGFFWMLLNPLLQLGIYTIVFSVIIKMEIEKFYLFLFVALVPWLFFSTCLSVGSLSVLSGKDLITKMYFPREVLPISFTVSQFINMLLSFIVIFVVIVAGGSPLRPGALVYLPLVMLTEFILALGMVYLTSSLTVYFRDLEHILTIVSMAWMYLTPVIYPVEYVPEKFRKLLYLNPMTSVTVAFRSILYYGKPPEMTTVWNALLLAAVVFAAGKACFICLKRDFARVL